MDILTRGRIVCIAILPRQIAGERREEIEQRPGDDNVVVDSNHGRYSHHGNSDSWREDVVVTVI